ncbi:MAG: M67 family metallopeptidase [Anaerolineaceae bacterium]|nr:M67 family metallopeptidase [Anaerolineaceae bacterium]
MDEIYLPRKYFKRILQYVGDYLPEESCGLLAGNNNQVTMIIFVTNQLHSPVKYYMDPMELYKALEAIDEENLELVGIFHSHPKGPSRPSETDIKEFLYPGTATLICFPDGNEWFIKAFMIENNHYSEMDLRIV